MEETTVKTWDACGYIVLLQVLLKLLLMYHDLWLESKVLFNQVIYLSIVGVQIGVRTTWSVIIVTSHSKRVVMVFIWILTTIRHVVGCPLNCIWFN